MLRPPYLKTGDQVALISPAGAIELGDLSFAIDLLKQWGLIPVFGKHVYAQQGYLAGTDIERTADLQWALDDDSIKAIFCTRGGYGTMRIVDKIDYSHFQGSPKWVIGFSDITALHAKINSLGFESMHAAMPKTFQSTAPDALDKLRTFLFGEITSYKLAPHPLNLMGTARAELAGGNLTILQMMTPTIHIDKHQRPILFIEDVGEEVYAIDRMLQSIRMSQPIRQVQGLIIGGFTDIQEDPRGENVYKVISEFAKQLQLPTLFQFPAGHQNDNYPLILGCDIELYIDEQGTEITFL